MWSFRELQQRLREIPGSSYRSATKMALTCQCNVTMKPNTAGAPTSTQEGPSQAAPAEGRSKPIAIPLQLLELPQLEENLKVGLFFLLYSRREGGGREWRAKFGVSGVP